MIETCFPNRRNEKTHQTKVIARRIEKKNMKSKILLLVGKIWNKEKQLIVVPFDSNVAYDYKALKKRLRV